MKETCDRRLKEAVPILQQSGSGLSRIKKVDIDELKSFVKPSETIVNVMAAVCIILKIEPAMHKDSKLGDQVKKDYWSAAIGSQCLANPQLIQLLTSVDPLSLN